jgi:hypothetical protein
MACHEGLPSGGPRSASVLLRAGCCSEGSASPCPALLLRCCCRHRRAEGCWRSLRHHHPGDGAGGRQSDPP